MDQNTNSSEFILVRLRSDEDELLYRIKTLRDRISDYDRVIAETNERGKQCERRIPFGWLFCGVVFSVVALVSLVTIHLLVAGLFFGVAAVMWYKTISELLHYRLIISRAGSFAEQYAAERNRANEELALLRTELSVLRASIARLENKKQ